MLNHDRCGVLPLRYPSVGIMVSYWIGYGTNYIGGTTYPQQSTAAWRIPLALQLVPAIVLCIGSWFLPYSPRWLMLVGREDECLIVLARLRDQDAISPSVQYEYRSLKVEAYAQRETNRLRYGTEKRTWRTEFLDYKRICTTKVLLHRVSLGAAVQAFGQWSGKPRSSVAMKPRLHIADLTRYQRNHLLRSNRFCPSRSLGRDRWITGHGSSWYPIVRLHHPRCSYGGQSRSQANDYLELSQHGYRTRHRCRPRCYLR